MNRKGMYELIPINVQKNILLNNFHRSSNNSINFVSFKEEGDTNTMNNLLKNSSRLNPIYTVKFKSTSKLSIDLNELQLSGWYILKVNLINRGREETWEKAIQFLNSEANHVQNEPGIIISTCISNDNIKYRLASLPIYKEYKQLVRIQSISRDTFFWQTIDKAINFDLSLKEEEFSGVFITTYCIVNNRMYVHEERIFNNWKHKKFEFKTVSSNSTSKKYSFSKENSNVLKDSIEILAILYDENLDKITELSWENDLFPSYKVANNFSMLCSEREQSQYCSRNRVYSYQLFNYRRLEDLLPLIGIFGRGSNLTTGYYSEIKIKSDPLSHVSLYHKASENNQKIIYNKTIRKKSNDQILFIPNVKVENNSFKIKYNLPDENGTWKLRLLAITKDLKIAYAEEIISQSKKVMIQPSYPKFIQEGDSVILRAFLSNTDKKKRKIEYSFNITDTSGKVNYNKLFSLTSLSNVVFLNSNASIVVEWKIYVPKTSLTKFRFNYSIRSGKNIDSDWDDIQYYSKNVSWNQSQNIVVEPNSESKYSLKNQNLSGSENAINTKEIYLRLDVEQNYRLLSKLDHENMKLYKSHNSIPEIKNQISNEIQQSLYNKYPKLISLFNNTRGYINLDLKTYLIDSFIDLDNDSTTHYYESKAKRSIGKTGNLEINEFNHYIDGIKKSYMKLGFLDSMNRSFGVRREEYHQFHWINEYLICKRIYDWNHYDEVIRKLLLEHNQEFIDQFIKDTTTNPYQIKTLEFYKTSVQYIYLQCLMNFDKNLYSNINKEARRFYKDLLKTHWGELDTQLKVLTIILMNSEVDTDIYRIWPSARKEIIKDFSSKLSRDNHFFSRSYIFPNWSHYLEAIQIVEGNDTSIKDLIKLMYESIYYNDEIISSNHIILLAYLDKYYNESLGLINPAEVLLGDTIKLSNLHEKYFFFINKCKPNDHFQDIRIINTNSIPMNGEIIYTQNQSIDQIKEYNNSSISIRKTYWLQEKLNSEEKQIDIAKDSIPLGSIVVLKIQLELDHYVKDLSIKLIKPSALDDQIINNFEFNYGMRNERFYSYNRYTDLKLYSVSAGQYSIVHKFVPLTKGSYSDIFVTSYSYSSPDMLANSQCGRIQIK